jgi:hypothetical protein
MKGMQPSSSPKRQMPKASPKSQLMLTAIAPSDLY